MAWDDKDVVEVMVLGDDESFAKMSGSDDDVEPYLYIQNTIGHGNHNSKSQRPKCVKTCRSAERVLDGGVCGKLWWYEFLQKVVESGEMVVAELKIFSFVRVPRTSGRRMSGGARSSSAWANVGMVRTTRFRGGGRWRGQIRAILWMEKGGEGGES